LQSKGQRVFPPQKENQLVSGQSPKRQQSVAHGGHAIHWIGHLKRILVDDPIRVDIKFL
jgi:hypothetical protein